MTALIGEVTRRLPDRWLAATLGPGMLWLAVAVLAVRLGHSRPAAIDTVTGTAHEIGEFVGARPAEAVVYGLLAIGGAVAISATARLLGACVRGMWLGRWRGPAAWTGRLLCSWRAHRARTRLARSDTRLPDAYLPHCPTWIGDRLRLADVRVTAQYGLSLPLVWPRLWQLVDADTRTLVQQARDRFDVASTLAGWASCYAVLVVFWWPAAVFAAVLLTIAWWRGRLAAAVFGDTVEATVDLKHRALTEALGYRLESGQALPPAMADAINDQLHKGATPQPQRSQPAHLRDRSTPSG